jgi:hypothetical protein
VRAETGGYNEAGTTAAAAATSSSLRISCHKPSGYATGYEPTATWLSSTSYALYITATTAA